MIMSCPCFLISGPLFKLLARVHQLLLQTNVQHLLHNLQANLYTNGMGLKGKLKSLIVPSIFRFPF